MIDVRTRCESSCAKVGAQSDNLYQWKLVGPSGPLADDGIDLAFEVGDKAPPPASACSDVVAAPSATEQGSIPAWLVIAAAGIVAFILATIVTLIRRKKR